VWKGCENKNEKRYRGEEKLMDILFLIKSYFVPIVLVVVAIFVVKAYKENPRLKDRTIKTGLFVLGYLLSMAIHSSHTFGKVLYTVQNIRLPF
jgi:hypothetical protein